MVVAGGLAAALALGGWWFAARPDAVDRHADRLRAEQAVRDEEQVDELTALARSTSQDVLEPVTGLDAALTGGPPPSAAELERWRAAVTSAQAAWGDPPSGATELNVARSSFAGAIDLLDATLAGYAVARERGGADEAALNALTARHLELVVRAWSTGATQLDWLNVRAGRGHQHVFLPVRSEGAMTADPAAEGSGAHDDHG